MSSYFVSLVLVTAYCWEAASSQALGFIKRATLPVPITPLHSLEIKNALRLKRYRKELTQTQLEGAIKCLQEDIASGFLQEFDGDLQSVFREAELLSAAHAASTGARSLDILHVDAALILKADEFISFDRRQRLVAKRSGLKVLSYTVPRP